MGKHGFLKAKGDDFEFEDGTVARFWCVNFNGGANFPELDYSKKLAKRLAKMGINLVRFHQLDAEWNTPNIFNFTKGLRCAKTTEFDEESMNLLDYFIYCLKNEGIYCYLDMLTYRRFKTEVVIEKAPLLEDTARPYCIYNRRMIELQKKYAYDLWNHVNPYTGLAYKDDPVFVMTEIINETDLFLERRPIKMEPYASEFRQMFSKWVSEQGISYDTQNCDINSPTDDILIQFKVYLQEKYYLEMYKCLREAGVKIPIAGTNWVVTPANVKTQLVTDFMDTHTYYYDWRWREFEKFFLNTSITQAADSPLTECVRQRVFGKPLYVSEWDMPWPNEFRAESPIYYAAIGALQGWSGLAIHAYSYCSNQSNMKMLGKEVSSTQIGSVPYREGVFSTWNDPAKFGLFYHAALITRRGDVSPANNKVVFKVDSMTEYNEEILKGAVEVSQIAVQFDDEEKTGVKYAEQSIIDLSKDEVYSDNKQLYRNRSKKFGKIDTPKTKCAYGFLGKNSPVEMEGLKISCKTDFSVIALSSLTDENIDESKSMLLTTVGRAKNTDAVFNNDQMLDFGKPPVLIEVIEANIEIKTTVKNLNVWAVNTEGHYIGTVPIKYEDGVLKVELGENSYSMYYLIQAE